MAPASAKETVASASELIFNAYPNPFNNQLTIVYSLPANCRKGNVSIYELASGKLVNSFEISADQAKVTLDNMNVAAGMYMCRLILDDGSSKQFKLVNIK